MFFNFFSEKNMTKEVYLKKNKKNGSKIDKYLPQVHILRHCYLSYLEIRNDLVLQNLKDVAKIKKQGTQLRDWILSKGFG